MASDKSASNKRYAVINTLCRFNQSFALRHKGPFLLLYKSFLRKFCDLVFAVQIKSDAICPYIEHQDKKRDTKNQSIPACVIPKSKKEKLPPKPFHKSVVIMLCLNQMEEYIKNCF